MDCPQKFNAVQAPRFSEAHIVSDKQIREEGTNYMICDPSHGKKRVMIWVRVAKDGKCYVCREWPSQVEAVKGFGFWVNGPLVEKRWMGIKALHRNH